MNSDNARPNTQPTHHTDVLLYVEQDAPSKFRIQSDQLEQIGAKLRGPRRFSVFNSLILPALVTLLTTVLTGTFQYLSWINTVRLQAATGVADRAAETFEKTAALIGQRTYATVIFIPTIRDLAQFKTPVKSAEAGATTHKSGQPANNQHNDGVLVTATTEPVVIAATQSLTNASYELGSRRYEAYYDQLKRWNEGYDQLIADIDYNLDRPILLDAEIPRTAITVFSKKISAIKCERSLPEELDRVGLDKRMLKIQFAAVNYCFRALHYSLDDQITQVMNRSLDAIDADFIKAANGRLADIGTTTNEFRCVALLRIGYYKQRTERSIVIPGFVRHWLFDPVKAAADDHFRDTEKGCNPENRPT